MRLLRAGLVGLGVMGQHHMRLLNQLEGVEFVGVYDSDLSKQETTVGRPVFSSFDNLLCQNLDYCVVAAPTSHHLEIGLGLALFIKSKYQEDLEARYSSHRFLPVLDCQVGRVN